MSGSRYRRALVTGGCGFIGNGFVRRILNALPDVQVCTLDRLSYAGQAQNLDDLPDPSRHRLVVGDIADAALVASVFEEHDPDLVVHFAAETHVDRSLHDPGVFVHSNLVGTAVLLEAARRSWAGRTDVRFHHVSTDEVYGSRAPDDAASTEASPYAPRSPYSASKAGSDHLVRAWAASFGLPVSLSLSCNIYGPRQHPEKLIPLMILSAAAGQPLPIYGDGRQVREWLHVEDVCDAILAVIQRGEAGAVYNISSEVATTNLEIVRSICGLLDQRLPGAAPHARLIRHVADRPGHDLRYALDATAIRQDLGWAPKLDLDAGLAQMVDWLLENPDWVTTACGPEFQAWIAQNYDSRGGSA